MDTLRRKAIKLIILATFGALPPVIFAQTSPPSSALQQYEAIAHPHFGCPENSQCDPTMGKLINQWKILTSKWGDQSPSAGELKSMMEQLGWPIEFYGHATLASTLAPVMFASTCTHHKKAQKPLSRILAFVRGSDKEHLIVKKAETEYRLKLEESAILQLVIHHGVDKKITRYYLPLGEKPLYIERDKLTAVVEHEDVYVLMTIPAHGLWEIKSLDGTSLMKYQDEQSDVPCPKEAIVMPAAFSKTYCQTVTDKAGKPNGIMQLFWDCP